MYVLEYEAVVYPRRERQAHEKEYIANDEGCYILDVQTPEGCFCLDATRCLLSPGRLMNHAQRAKASLAPFKPLLVEGKWRVGFTATRDLCQGEELTWDYGCAPGGIDWLIHVSDQRQSANTTPSQTQGEFGYVCACICAYSNPPCSVSIPHFIIVSTCVTSSVC